MATSDPLRPDNKINRAFILVRGIVQGVGFRPFVHRIANEHNLAGWVLNSTEGVEIEVEGTTARIERFVEDLSTKAPPLAVIYSLDVHFLPSVGYSSFIIAISHQEESGFPLISPDIATCPDCLQELTAPVNRRYHYPFINCTNCGPRFTIVEGVPYDRPNTTMKLFGMCPSCKQEYQNPLNRRFHAQPNACPECGPSLWLERNYIPPLPKFPCGSSANPGGTVKGREAIIQAKLALKAGRIVAVKGLGGFHLACDATNADAVGMLRERKRRVEKPFAVMVRDLQTADKLCYLRDSEAQLLSSVRRPIVLLERRPGGPVVEEVAPFNRRLGVILPYTPVHYLLLEPDNDFIFDALVMTSGNLSEEPIAKDNGEAIERLDSLADFFLMHDRPIHTRCDDSVTQVLAGRESIIRRSRGYTPMPVQLDFDLEPVLACGGDLKSTFCITQGRFAFLSPHLGDLENLETMNSYEETVRHFRRLFNLNPRIVAHDLHPNYFSTRYALSLAENSNETLKVIGVQHHHAHIAGCMAENGLSEKVIGVAFDGTGYGNEGTLWGGEFLVADYLSFQRAAHLKYIPMPGGTAAIAKPYRMAISYLISAYDRNLPAIESLCWLDRIEFEAIKVQIARGINSPLTSSCGRLFDAVSALLDIRQQINYEGQAAVELEMAVEEEVTDSYAFSFLAGNPVVIDASPVIRAIVSDLQRGERRGLIAARFHNGVAEIIGEACDRIRTTTGLDKVCLSGGVFQNRFLLRRALGILQQRGFEVFSHHQVPANDGGIALGQAIIASEQVRMSRA